MFAMVVLCSSGLVSCSVAAEHADAVFQAEHADDIADEHADDRGSEIRKQQLLEPIIARCIVAYYIMLQETYFVPEAKLASSSWQVDVRQDVLFVRSIFNFIRLLKYMHVL